MTQGNRTADNLHVVESYWGYTQVGDKYNKIWMGNDRQNGEPEGLEHRYEMTIQSQYDHLHDFLQVGHSDVRKAALTQLTGDIIQYLPEVWDSNDELKLINKTAAKTRGSDFNLGNFVGESRQTIALVATTATRIAKMLHYLRDGNLYKAKKEITGVKVNSGHVLSKKNRKPLTASNLSDAVLELQYGWRPLISDVHDSMQSLAVKLNGSFSTRVKTTRKTIANDVITIAGIKLFRVTTCRVEYRAYYNTPLSTSTQFHLNDPLSVAWEVMPWSFVADWFLPIGDYLGGLDYFRSFNIGDLWSTRVIEKRLSFAGNADSIDYIILSDSQFYRKEKYLLRDRVLTGTVDLPVPTFKSMKKALQPEHLLNAFALLTSTTDGIRKQLKF